MGSHRGRLLRTAFAVVVSAPLITTLVDATGLVIYFLIALAVLPELHGVLG